MYKEELMKQIVDEVMKNLANLQGNGSQTQYKNGSKITKDNYPLGEKMADKVYSPTGKRLSDMKLEQIFDGTLTAEDMRISPETLEMQAQVAESAGNINFAANLRRAAELIAVPDERVLEIYNAMRPYRSTKQELLDIADELEQKYNAKINADFIREAASVYEQRKRLKQA